MEYIFGVLFGVAILLFFYLVIILADANIRKDIIKKIIKDKGIIWNPLKIGFLVYDGKNKTDSIKLIQLINYSVGSFIYQFVLYIQSKFKNTDREIKRYIKLNYKYKTGIYCEHCKGYGICNCLECRAGTCKYCNGEKND